MATETKEILEELAHIRADVESLKRFFIDRNNHLIGNSALDFRIDHFFLFKRAGPFNG